MKTIKETTNKNGKRVVTVELDQGEVLRSFQAGQFYKLGYPLDDIVSGHHIICADTAVWDVIGQEWVVCT